MACTNADPQTIGSIESSGIAPWAPLPEIFISKLSAAAIMGPGATRRCPASKPGILCMPYIELAGNFSNRPSSIIAFAPANPSSAG